MKLRRSFMFAVALIGGLSAISAGGIEPSAPLQLSLLLPPSASQAPDLLGFLASSSQEDAKKARPRCTRDSDCRLHDYYCDGCNCLSLPVGMNPPKCNGTIVQCLVAPCMNKRAACVEGNCVVQDGSASR